MGAVPASHPNEEVSPCCFIPVFITQNLSAGQLQEKGDWPAINSSSAPDTSLRRRALHCGTEACNLAL